MLKKNILKKIRIIILAFVFTFTSMVIPIQRSQAVGPGAGILAAASGAGYLAMGAYVLGAVVVAGGATVIGLDYADEIKTTATNSFNRFNESQKEMWSKAAEASIALGKSSLTLTQEMLDSLSSIKDGIASDISTLLKSKEQDIKIKNSVAFFTSSTKRNISLQDVTWSLGAGGMTQPKWGIKNEGGSYKLYYATSVVAADSNYAAVTITTARTDIFNTIVDYSSFLVAVKKMFGYDLIPQSSIPSEVPAQDYFNGAVDQAITGLSGTKEVNIPLDQFLAKNATGQTVSYDEATSTVLNPDGTPYTGDITWDFPIPALNTGSTAVPTFGNPAVPITEISVGDIPIVAEPYVPPTPPPPPTTGVGSPIWSPFALLMPFVDFLLACVMFVINTGLFILKIPLVPAKDIPHYNDQLQFFKDFTIGGIKPYSIMITVSMTLFGFAIFKVIRRIFNG